MKSLPGIGLACLFLLGGFFLGFSGSVDDAHITYWSAWVLGNQGEILNYNFERIEQSSALLQVIVLAALHALTAVSVVTLGHVVTMGASVLAVFQIGKIAERIDPFIAEPAILLLSTSPFFVYWTFAGMEGPLLALLLLLTVVIWQNYLEQGVGFVLVVMLALATQMTRPEMLLVSNLAAVLIVVMKASLKINHWEMTAALKLVLINLACALTILLWRRLYFDSFWPQPVLAKSGGDILANTMQGMRYAYESCRHAGLMLPTALSIGALVCAIRRARESQASSLLLAAIFAFVYTVFVITSGGDWMAAGRFWVPVVPLFVLLLASMMASLVPIKLVRRCLLGILVAGHCVYLWNGVGTDFNGVPLWKQNKLVQSDRAVTYSFFERHGREHLHDIPTLAFMHPLIKQIRALRPDDQPVRLMVGQAGMVMFYLSQSYSGGLYVIDRNGLVERLFTDCPVAQRLPHTRNGVGNGYAWIVEHYAELRESCGFVLPDVIFDIDTSWNKKNTEALRSIGYVLLYRQQGHIVEEGGVLPIRTIYAGQYVAVSQSIYTLLGSPQPIERIFK